MVQRIMLSLVLVVYATSIWAQQQSLIFTDELCTYQGFYNSSKYSEKQLLETQTLLRNIAFYYGDEKALIEESYLAVKKELNELSVVEDPFFIALLDSAHQYLEKSYEARIIQVEAKENPKKLLQLYPENAEIKYYADALVEGKEKLLTAYMALTKKQMENNSEPERLWNNYKHNISLPNKYALAFDYVLTYGWWNAVNNQIPHISYDQRQFDAYLKLFIKVDTLDCDEI